MRTTRSNARQATARTPRAARSIESERSTVAPASTEPPKEDNTKRVSFALKADGTFDVENMRTSGKDALRTALADPTLGAALGLTSTQVETDTRLLETIASGLYDGLSFVGVALAKRAGYSDSQAALAAFTEKEKETLAGPTVAVANKYFPDIGGKYRDEIMLCLALVNVIGAKILLLRAGARIAPDGTITMSPERSTVAPARVIPINEGEPLPS